MKLISATSTLYTAPRLYTLRVFKRKTHCEWNLSQVRRAIPTNAEHGCWRRHTALSPDPGDARISPRCYIDPVR